MAKKAGILCIGTELTTGKNLDTNSQYLARKLFMLGIEVTGIWKLPDQFSVLKESLLALLKDNDIVILSGGLGPTQDDITKDAVKDALNLQTEYSEAIYKKIEKRFKKRGYKICENNRSQAVIFKNNRVLQNDFGTAPGFLVEKKGRAVVLLPGPPAELIPMFEKKAVPFLKKKFMTRFYHKVFRLFGLSESLVAEKLNDIDRSVRELKGDLTYLSSPNFIDVIISSSYNINKIKILAQGVRKIFNKNIYAEKWENIYQIVSNLLLSRGLTISAAESCTGGLLAKTLTDIPGSSGYFKFGIICYSNESKMKLLGVQKETLRAHGAVSEQTALEMLHGLQKSYRTDISVSITGIAGPSGGTREKPAGLVYAGLMFRNNIKIHKFIFTGDRARIREVTVNKVFELLYQCLKK